MNFDLGLGVAGNITLSIAGLVALFLLLALLLRSACDLSGLDPSPGYLRCLIVAAVFELLAGAAGYGVALAIRAVSLPETLLIVANIVANVAINAAVGTALFLIAFRSRFTKASLLWLIYALLRLLVGSLLFLLAIGGWTTVGAVRRLF
jgi:hypothetical protein